MPMLMLMLTMMIEKVLVWKEESLSEPKPRVRAGSRPRQSLQVLGSRFVAFCFVVGRCSSLESLMRMYGIILSEDSSVIRHRETEKLEEFACFLVTGSNLKLTVENPEFIPDQRQKRETSS
jgi:hypothetical protein